MSSASGPARLATRCGGDGIDVEQQQGQLHASETVGERMVELHHQSGPVALEVLDQREFPQGPGAVERVIAARRAKATTVSGM